MILSESLKLSQRVVAEAAEKAQAWKALTATTRPLRTVEDAANAAPKILPLDQSVLHVWSAMEALFPNVGAELKFRIALYIAQLTRSGSARQEVYERVRTSYDLRSGITHGSRRDVSEDQWKDTWGLLIDACNAVIRRGALPSEQELIVELLS